jgi:hypothetical protein
MKNWAALALSGMLCACATIQSESRTTAHEGVAYRPPMRFVRVTAVRAQVAPAQARAALNEARTAYLAEIVRAAPIEAERNRLVAEATAARSLADRAGPAVRPALEEAAQLARAHADVASDRHSAAQRVVTEKRTAYETALANAENAAQPGWGETITLTLGEPFGDPRHRFVARLQDSAFRGVAGAIHAPNGLLQSSNVTTAGGVEATLVGIAQSIVGLQSRPIRAAAAARQGASAAAPACEADGDLTAAQTLMLGPATYTRDFDPTDATQVNQVNQALCNLGFSYRVRPEVPNAASAPGQPLTWSAVSTGTTFADTASPCTPECGGLVYRQDEPVRIDVRKIDTTVIADAGYVARTFIANIPNASPLYVLPYGDAFFVTRRDDVAFSNGSLVSLTYDHPSEAAIAAGAPFRIVNAAAAAASQLVQLRLNLTNQRQQLANAEGAPGTSEVAQLENQVRILQLRQQIAQLEAQVAAAEAAAPPE